MIEGLRVCDRQGGDAPREGGGWVLEEARTWMVTAPGGPWEVLLDDAPLAWDAALGGVRLELPFAVGHLTLTLARAGERWRLPLRVRPAQEKLDTPTWEALLADLEGWLPGLSAGVEGPRVGRVGLTGVAAPLYAEAVLPLLPTLEAALRVLLEQPRQRQEDRLSEVPLHRTRAATLETVAWLSSHPREAAWLHPEKSVELSGPPPSLPVRATRDTLDHPANRHVAWLLLAVQRRLGEAAGVLAAAKASELNRTGAWIAARVAALRRWAARLERLRRRSFLRGLRAAPATESAMLVVLDHPLYARVHRLSRRVLAARFALESGPEAAATRPSFDLYELWCFLRLQRWLAAELGEGWRWKGRGLERLLALSGTGAGARFTARSGERRLSLLFNPTFTGALVKPKKHGRVSVSTERRPDIVLAWEGRGRRGWLALDAKYRAGAKGIGRALEAAHIYRDALRWPRYGGRCAGTWLLVPRRTADAALWFGEDFHREHGLGAVCLRPREDPGAALAGVAWGSIGDW